MEKVVLYGAGKIFKAQLPLLLLKYDVLAIIDKKETGKIFDIPVITLENYISKYQDIKIILTVNVENQQEIIEVLKNNKIENFVSYSESGVVPLDKRQRLISYSQLGQMEDVILYNVLKDYNDIFYIDVGSNDPIVDNVTKLFYDMKSAHGINIEPQEDLIALTNNERPRDTNLSCAVSDDAGIHDLYLQCGRSTLLEKNINSDYYDGKESVTTRSLKSICSEYISEGQIIHFLKIDVEGYEKKVLLSADFEKYRPYIIVIESTLPDTDIPCYDEWEYILIKNNYHFVFSYGVNRYYVCNEMSNLDNSFLPVIELLKKYKIIKINLTSSVF